MHRGNCRSKMEDAGSEQFQFQYSLVGYRFLVFSRPVSACLGRETGYKPIKSRKDVTERQPLER